MNDIMKSWGVGIGVGLVAVLALVYLAKRAKDAGVAALGLVDPTSDTNIAYKGAQSVKEAVTGSDAPIGVDIWNLFNGVEAKRSAEVGTMKDPKVQEAIAKKKAGKTPTTKKQGGSWTPGAADPTAAPSILIPDTGGTGPSFESQSRGPWSPY